MIYNTAKDWQEATHKRVLLFGMSGLGKTYLANMLRGNGSWYHYSVDYRIGSRYLGEDIADNLKSEAMKNGYLRDLLRSDSIDIRSNITFENLAPLSMYLGKPGNPEKGGLAFNEYLRRQAQHRTAEIAALKDTAQFIKRAQSLYAYDHFVCDTGGSICEVVDALNPRDPVLTELSKHLLLVWINGSEAHTDELIRRFVRAPKPMYYQRGFLTTCWREYLSENKTKESEVDPDDFIRSTYARALAHRQPRYRAMADNWGISIAAKDVAKVKSPDDFETLIAQSLSE